MVLIFRVHQALLTIDETDFRINFPLVTNENEQRKSRIEDKSILISSIFPESLQFDGNKCRTPRVNDVLRYILQIYRYLPKN